MIIKQIRWAAIFQDTKKESNNQQQRYGLCIFKMPPPVKEPAGFESELIEIEYFLRKNLILRFWGWLSLLNWIGALALYLLLKLPPRKLELRFVLWSFFLLSLLCIFINLPYSLAWNTVAMSGLVLLVATWICWISYKNGYAKLLVLHSLLLLNPWLIVEM